MYTNHMASRCTFFNNFTGKITIREEYTMNSHSKYMPPPSGSKYWYTAGSKSERGAGAKIFIAGRNPAI